MPNLNQLQLFKNLLKKVRQPTEQEVAHMIAQRHAAMPTAQGGLGLPPANTPMDRAAAMGYDLPAYRGTRADEAALYANTQQIPGKVRSGTGAFMSENPHLASTYAGNAGGNVMPVMVRSQGMPVVEAGGAPWSDIGGLDTNEIARRALAAGQPGVRFKNVADPGAHIRGVQDIPETANNLTTFNPADVRSRFAAFDPLKQHSEDLLHAEGGRINVAPYGMRHDSMTPKGLGYFGKVPNPQGGFSTEISSYDPEIGDYPLMAPTMTQEEIKHLVSGGIPTDDIYRKAELWARTRKAQGMSPFAGSGELRLPLKALPE